MIKKTRIIRMIRIIRVRMIRVKLIRLRMIRVKMIRVTEEQGRQCIGHGHDQ